MDVNKKRQDEKEIVKLMICVYCHGEHGSRNNELCEDCRELLRYVFERIERCPFMETKSFCSACKTHCYKPEMRERIKRVMRYAGPKMLLYHPIVAIRHMMVSGSANRKGAH